MTRAVDPAALLHEYLAEASVVTPGTFDRCPSWARVVEAPPALQLELVLAFVELSARPDWERSYGRYARIAAQNLMVAILKREDLPVGTAEAARLAEARKALPQNALTALLQRVVQTSPVDERLRVALVDIPLGAAGAATSGRPYAIDAWSTLANDALQSMPDADRGAWSALLAHFMVARVGYPAATAWRTQTRRLVDAIGRASLAEPLARWLAAVEPPTPAAPPPAAKGLLSLAASIFRGAPAPAPAPFAGRTDLAPCGLPAPFERNARVLHGLVECAGELNAPAVDEAVAHVATVAFSTVPGLGAYLPQLGFRCIDVLARRESARALLARIEPQLGHPRARAYARAALDSSA